MDEEMILGDLVPEEGGWYKDKKTGNRVSPDGEVFNHQGEKIWDPSLDKN